MSSSSSNNNNNNNYLPSVKHQWKLMGYNTCFMQSFQSVQFQSPPFSVGTTKWQIEWRFPSNGIWLKRISPAADAGASDETVSFRLSAYSDCYGELMKPKDFTVSFTAANEEMQIYSLDENKNRSGYSTSFTFEFIVRPEVYADGLPTDFRVVVLDKGDEEKVLLAEFAAHRSILSKGSDVFKAMLGEDSKFEEAKTGVLKIGNFTPETVRALLSFIYTGKIGVCKRGDPYFYGLDCGDYAAVLELLDAAEQYQVEGTLKKECGARLLALISAQNAVELLTVVERYKLGEDLKKTTMRYIREYRYLIILNGNNDDALKRLPPETTLELLKVFSQY